MCQYYYKEACLRGRSVEWTDELKDNINKVARLLSNADAMYGIMIIGTTGNGKTTLARAICNTINSFAREDTWPFTNDYAIFVDAQDFVDSYTEDKEWYKTMQIASCLIIDDLGTEYSETVHYGERANPIEHTIRKRYNDRKFTIITTNLSPDAFSKKYDERIVDRIAEMYPDDCLIVFTHDSYR